MSKGLLNPCFIVAAEAQETLSDTAKVPKRTRVTKDGLSPGARDTTRLTSVLASRTPWGRCPLGSHTATTEADWEHAAPVHPQPGFAASAPPLVRGEPAKGPHSSVGSRPAGQEQPEVNSQPSTPFPAPTMFQRLPQGSETHVSLDKAGSLLADSMSFLLSVSGQEWLLLTPSPYRSPAWGICLSQDSKGN